MTHRYRDDTCAKPIYNLLDKEKTDLYNTYNKMSVQKTINENTNNFFFFC